MDHSVLTILDLGIIAAYLVIMVLVGVYSVRRIQNTKDYYVAGRSFGPMVLMATVCATIIGGSGLMGRAGVAYTDGFKAVLTAIPYLLGMFIFSGIAGKISDIGMQYGITSIPELFERRFGRAAKITLSVLIAFAMMGTVASQVTATATIIRMLGGEFGLSYEMGALIATVVFMVYTATSGLFGVVYTDVLQFYMLIVFVYILIPVAALFNVGGFANFAANLDPALVEPHIDGSILGDIITYLVFTMAGAEMWQRAFAAKSRRAAKRGMFLGTAVYGVTIVLVYFMGVVGRQILGGDILAQYGSTDAVVPALAIRILPAIRPQMPERTEISLSRIFSIVLPLGALVIALYIHNAYNILMFAWSFYAASAGIPAFAALFWKKATKTGVMAGLLGGFVVCVGWKLAGQPFGLGAAVPGTVACGIALVVVSLATYKRAPSVFLKAEKQS